MLFHKIPYLFAQTVGQRSGRGSKKRIGRHFVRDAKQTVLHAAQRILQAKVQRCSSCCFQIPHRFALCNTHTQIQHPPRFADL